MTQGKITIHGAVQPLDRALPPILTPMGYTGENLSLFVRGEGGAPFSYHLMRHDTTRFSADGVVMVGVAKVQAPCGTIGGLIAAIEAAMASPTIDDAIAAWKAAETASERLEAEEAIEQDIAHETPEGGDYEYATAELIGRLKAECGPVPTPDDGVYEDEACTVAIEDEATLPSIFYHLSGDDLTRYWHMQPHTYDRHERRVAEDGGTFWFGLGSETIDGDTTAEEFLENQGD